MSVMLGAVSAGAVKVTETVIASFFASRRRKSEQRDADVEAIRAVAFEVRDIAKCYWLKEGRDHDLEGAITGRLLFIGTTVEELFSSNLALRRQNEFTVNGFDKSCTGGNFATNNRAAEPGRANAIESSVYTLIHQIRRDCRRL